MTFNPVDLAFLDSSGNYLKHVSSNGSVHTYQKYFPDGTADHPENKVTYNSSDFKWRDTGTDHPYGFKINTSSTTTAPYNTGYDTVSVATLQNNTQYVHMNTSTQGGPWATVQMDGWSATGSGPGTLSVVPTEFTTSVPSGVTPFDGAGPELYYTIAKTEASGQYNIYMDDVYYATATHTNGSVSEGQVPGRSFALNAKMYFGQVYTSSSLNTLVSEFTWPTIKKVHSNFW